MSAKGSSNAKSSKKVGDARVHPPIPPATSEAVSKSMKGNKGKDTKPELTVRRTLREAGLTGYRLHWKVPGHPDVAWPGKRVAIEVRGCFWHRCPHCSPPVPKSNVEYWAFKFESNQERDARNLEALRDAGWTVHVVWECQLKKQRFAATMAKLIEELAVELGKTPKAEVLEDLRSRAGK